MAFSWELVTANFFIQFQFLLQLDIIITYIYIFLNITNLGLIISTIQLNISHMFTYS